MKTKESDVCFIHTLVLFEIVIYFIQRSIYYLYVRKNFTEGSYPSPELRERILSTLLEASLPFSDQISLHQEVTTGVGRGGLRGEDGR